MSKKFFKPTPIPHLTKYGEPMAYYALSDDGKVYTEVSRSVCLARIEDFENPFPQRWYVDEESGLVVRLPRNQMGEDLARENMRSIWREEKYRERKFQCVWKGTNKCNQKCEQTGRTCFTVELDEKYCDVIVKRYIDQVQSDENVYLLRNGEKVKYCDIPKGDSDE